jgi:hypothetical protein
VAGRSSGGHDAALEACRRVGAALQPTQALGELPPAPGRALMVRHPLFEIVLSRTTAIMYLRARGAMTA